MYRFTIQANNYLKQNIQGFYHEDYHGGGNWQLDGTIENIITTLKNDIPPYKDEQTLNLAISRLKQILKRDLQEIFNNINLDILTVCVVPRAKTKYEKNQLLFRKTVQEVIAHLNGYDDGVNFLIRKENTRTTHRNRAGYGGDGDMPYPGITKHTCAISSQVFNKNILLIDDLYTKTINIDEDAIQALLDFGAKSVRFYAPGKTVYNY